MAERSVGVPVDRGGGQSSMRSFEGKRRGRMKRATDECATESAPRELVPPHLPRIITRPSGLHLGNGWGTRRRGSWVEETIAERHPLAGKVPNGN